MWYTSQRIRVAELVRGGCPRFHPERQDLDGQHVKLVDKSHDWRGVNEISPDGQTVVLSYRGDPDAPYHLTVSAPGMAPLWFGRE